LGAGFALVPLGVLLHRKLSRVLDNDDHARALNAELLEGAPSSSAAPLSAVGTFAQPT
jgi:hypothetical protein